MRCLLLENYSNARQVWSSRSFLQFLWGLRPNKITYLCTGCIFACCSVGIEDTLVLQAYGASEKLTRRIEIQWTLSAVATNNVHLIRLAIGLVPMVRSRLCKQNISVTCKTLVMLSSGGFCFPVSWCSNGTLRRVTSLLSLCKFQKNKHAKPYSDYLHFRRFFNS